MAFGYNNRDFKNIPIGYTVGFFFIMAILCVFPPLAVLFLIGIAIYASQKKSQDKASQEAFERVLGSSSTTESQQQITVPTGSMAIFEALLNQLFPMIKMGGKTELPSSDDAGYEKIKKSSGLIYVQNFAKKFGTNYSEEDFKNLRDLLLSKSSSLDFSHDDIKLAIKEETFNHKYERFKILMAECPSTTVDDYLSNFSKVFESPIKDLEGYAQGKDRIIMGSGNILGFNEKVVCVETDIMPRLLTVTENAHFLKQLLAEKSISLNMNDEQYVGTLLNYKRSNELSRFESRLLDDKFYSIEQIDQMTGYEFEEFLKLLFEKQGYLVEHTKLSGDQGADLVVKKFGQTTVVQAKRCGTKTGNSAVQEVVASIKHYNADKGMVITSGGFTASCAKLASSNHIRLIDRQGLIRLVQEHL